MSVYRNQPFSDAPKVLQNRRIMSGEGFPQFDGGQTNNTHGQQLPPGSRLHQYLHANQRQEPVPGPSFGPGTPININAAPFIPKHQQQQQQAQPPTPQPVVNQFAQMAIHDVPQQMIPYSQAHQLPFGGPLPHHRHQQHHSPQIPHPPPLHPFNQYQQESRGGTTYFFADDQTHEEDQYDEPELPENSLIVNTQGSFSYNAPLPMSHVARFRGKPNANLQTQFISSEFRHDLVQRQLAFDTKADPNVYPEIPPAVEHYSSLVPLENINLQNQSQTTYKAFSCRDGGFYCLRRVHGFTVTQPGKQTYPAEQWKKIVHGNVAPLRELLINCRAFGDSSLVFVYDYYPMAETLMSKHFEKSAAFFDSAHGFRLSSPGSMQCVPVTEPILWSYLIQITGALRAIHACGLASRSVDLSKILIYGTKLVMAFSGVQDILNPDHLAVQNHQVEDLSQLGNLLLALAGGRPNAYRKDLIQGTMKIIQDSYSHDFNVIISYLTNDSNRQKSVNDLIPLIGCRFYTVIETIQARSDLMEAELSKELENGRLFRLLTKLNTIVERAEHGGDESWAETGDRFMLKLFRDYVFHQVTDQGKPWLDMAHIVQCLNKLDAGSVEKIEMVSRSGDTQIIIDYATLKRCLDKSFRELAIPVMPMMRH